LETKNDINSGEQNMNKGSFKKLFLLFGWCISFYVFADIQKIEYFDSQYYHPEEFGLRDLVFKIKISGLEEELTREKIFGKVENLYFQVFWMYPGKYKIEVNGIPKGFDDRVEMLRQMVKTRMDFVIPQKLAPQMRGYTFTSKVEQNQKIYNGEDKTGKNPQRELQLIFDNKGRLLSVKSMGTMGVNISKLQMNKKKWSKGQWVLDELLSEVTNMNNVTTTINHKFNYLEENGFGLPETIIISTNYKAPGVDAKTKNIESIYTFSDYQVNTGRGKKTIETAEQNLLKK